MMKRLRAARWAADDRYFNQTGIVDLYEENTGVVLDGNVFFQGAKPSHFEGKPALQPDFDPALQLIERADGYYLQINFDKAPRCRGARRAISRSKPRAMWPAP